MNSADNGVNDAVRQVIDALGIGGQTLTNAIDRLVVIISNGAGKILPGIQPLTKGVDDITNKVDTIIHDALEDAGVAGLNVTHTITSLISNAVNQVTQQLAPAPVATNPAPKPATNPAPKPAPIPASKPAPKPAPKSVPKPAPVVPKQSTSSS